MDWKVGSSTILATLIALAFSEISGVSLLMVSTLPLIAVMRSKVVEEVWLSVVCEPVGWIVR